MTPLVLLVCFTPVFLLVVLVLAVAALAQLTEAAIAFRRRRAKRRCATLLAEYSKTLKKQQHQLEQYADLSRWVTANMLLASHRERRRGVEATA